MSQDKIPIIPMLVISKKECLKAVEKELDSQSSLICRHRYPNGFFSKLLRSKDKSKELHWIRGELVLTTEKNGVADDAKNFPLDRVDDAVLYYNAF